MRFEDSLQVYSVSGGGVDENGNQIAPSVSLDDYSKCFISFNSSAQKVVLHDGSEYQYTYYVIMPLNAAKYSAIPREGDRVHITKADGTIDCDKEVKGFVTYKKRYLKIWL